MKIDFRAALFLFSFALPVYATNISDIYTTKSERLEIAENLIKQISNEQSNNDEVNSRMPAAPVSRVEITWVGIHNGRFEVDVLVMGNGNRITTVQGGLSNPRLVNTQMIGRPIVTGWVYTYDLGPVIRGSFTFNISVRSFNSPWNTMSHSVRFTW